MANVCITSISRALCITSVFATAIALYAQAQAQTLPAEPQEELVALEAKRDALRAELASTEARIAEIEKAHDANTDASQPETQPAAKDLGTEKPVALSVLLQGMPPELRPETRADKGPVWPEIKLLKAQRWIDERVVGKQLVINVEVDDVKTSRLPDAHDRSETAGWSITLRVKSASEDLLGRTHILQVGASETAPVSAAGLYKIHYSGPGFLQLYRDEKTARAADKLKPGQRLRLQGTITRAKLGNRSQATTLYEHIQVGTLDIMLSQFTIIGGGL